MNITAKRGPQAQLTVNGNKQYSDRLYVKDMKLERTVVDERSVGNVTIIIMVGEGVRKKSGNYYIVNEYRTAIIPSDKINIFNRNKREDINAIWHYDTPQGRLGRILDRDKK
jgi:hypothetical protein|tara:strand:- start:183 stop:518 length:336 start_codon:yes stop_codon:yes gene_type:complete